MIRSNRLILILITFFNLVICVTATILCIQQKKDGFDNFHILFNFYFPILSLIYLLIYNESGYNKINTISFKNLKTNFNLFFLGSNKTLLINNFIILFSFSIILGVLGIENGNILLVLTISTLFYLFIIFLFTYTINYVLFYITLYLMMFDIIFHYNLSSWNPCGSLLLSLFS